MKTILGAGSVEITLLLYNIGALVGGLVGKWYYLPNPAWVSAHFILTDFRHAGAILGALVGTAFAALIAPHFRRATPSRMLGLLALLPLALLTVLLFQQHSVVGGTTLLLLLVPWLPQLKAASANEG